MRVVVGLGLYAACNVQRNPYSCLQFETRFDAQLYGEYQSKILLAATEPENPVPLLELMELLVYQGLGKPALAALKRALDVLEKNPSLRQSSHSKAVSQVLISRLSRQFYAYYDATKHMAAIVDLFPESPVLLSQAAEHFHHIHYDEVAEPLYIGALMLQPSHEPALLNYARFCAERGRYRLAQRYLSRITNEEASPLWLVARLEAARVQELQGVEGDVLCVAYKGCVPFTSNSSHHAGSSSDRHLSCALHSLAHHHFLQREFEKARDYHGRALKSDPDNYLAMLLLAGMSAMHLKRAPAGGLTSHTTTKNAILQQYSLFSRELPSGENLEEIDAYYRRGVLLLPQHRYRWVPTLAYADFLCCTMRDQRRAEQYYNEASQAAFSTSVWSTLALSHFLQYVKNDVGANGRLLLRLLRHRHPEVQIDCLTDFNAFRHHAAVADPAQEMARIMSSSALPPQTDTASPQLQHMTPEERTEKNADEDEIVALYTVIAYYLMDLQEWEDAMKYAAAALGVCETYAPALRCIALITWYQHGVSDNVRRAALRYFNTAFEFGSASSACVQRTCGVVKAMEGQQHTALSMLESAARCGPNCALTLRALGCMTYLYSGNAEHAEEYLSAAFALSGEEDHEALRLKAQVLMDQRRHKEARVCLQQALYLLPWDPATLACLATCVAKQQTRKGKSTAAITAVGAVTAATAGMAGSGPNAAAATAAATYSYRLRTMRSFEALIHSRDPEELFEAALTVDLQRIVALNSGLPPTEQERYHQQQLQQHEQKHQQQQQHHKRLINPFQASKDNVLSNFAADTVIEATAEAASHGSSAGSIAYAYYQYGLYELDKSTIEGSQKAKTLFHLAIKSCEDGAGGGGGGGGGKKDRANGRVCTIYGDPCIGSAALYMLGSLAEQDGNLEPAERLYCSAVDACQADPIAILRLARLVQRGVDAVKKMMKICARAAAVRAAAGGGGGGGGGKHGKNSRSKQSRNTGQVGVGNVDSSGTMSTFHPPQVRSKKEQLMDSLSDLLRQTFDDTGRNRSDVDDNNDDDDDVHPDSGQEQEHGEEGEEGEEEGDTGMSAAVAELQRRRLLHQRVEERLALHRYTHRKLIKRIADTCPMGTNLHVGGQWLQRLLFAFSKCEDWACLMQSSRSHSKVTARYVATTAVAAAGTAAATPASNIQPAAKSGNAKVSTGNGGTTFNRKGISAVPPTKGTLGTTKKLSTKKSAKSKK